MQLLVLVIIIIATVIIVCIGMDWDTPERIWFICVQSVLCLFFLPPMIILLFVFLIQNEK